MIVGCNKRTHYSHTGGDADTGGPDEVDSEHGEGDVPGNGPDEEDSVHM